MHANPPFLSRMPRSAPPGAGVLETGPHDPANRRNAPVRSRFAPLGRSLRRLLDRLAAIDAELRLRTELERLDDHMLRDVGLSRAEIAAEIRRHPRFGLGSASDSAAGETREPSV